MSKAIFGAMYGLMSYERARQEKLCAQGKFPWTCADPNVSNAQRLAVLAEEIGEVAEALLEAKQSHLDTELTEHVHKLRLECVQVAAVCRAWIEAMLRIYALEPPTEIEARARFENHMSIVESVDVGFVEPIAHLGMLFGRVARRVCEQEINLAGYSARAHISELLDLLSFALAWAGSCHAT